MAKLLVVFSALLVCALGAKIDASLSWRIVGGSNAAPGQFPYQISMRNGGSHSCGGSIINSITILTAAHCVAGQSASRLTVVTGTNQLNNGGTSYAVKTIKSHSKYSPLLLKNDVAVLILKEPIQFGDNVAPIELASQDVAGAAGCVLSGWGRTSYPGSIPNDLQFINLKTLSTAECKKYHIFPSVDATQVCTLTQEGEGACHGDSGGPLVGEDGKQIGIVSWGTPCARGNPDVFTSVSAFRDWINENTESA